jgi:hypothetical protein
VIETLKDDSQILLLYLAGELPDEDRSNVEQRLVSEPALNREFECLRSVQQEFEAAMARADEVTGLPVNANAIAGSIGREMRRWMAEPRLVMPVTKQPSGKKLRPWLVPSAVAAAILVASLLWMNRSGEIKTVVIRPPTPPVVQQDENLDLFRTSFDSTSLELADALNGNNSKRESAPQDDISQYLLNVGTAQD